MAVNEFLEFQKQYDKTYIRVKFEGKDNYQVVSIRGCIQDDAKKPYLILHNPIVGQCTVNWGETKQNLNYDFPAIGLFNHQQCFLMFYRFPDRQWKRGISSGNSHIIDPLQQIKARVPGLCERSSMGCIDYNCLTSAFSEIYPINMDFAVDMLGNPTRLGVALNPMFGLTKSPIITHRIILWKHCSMIGYLDSDTHTISVQEESFQQEVLDYLKRQQEYMWTIR